MAHSLQRVVRRFADATRALLKRPEKQRTGAETTGKPLSSTQPEFVPSGHFYSPLPDVAEVGRRAKKLFDTSVRTIPGVDLNVDAQLELLEELKKYYVDQPFTAQPTKGNRYHFENPMYSYSDALLLHCMLRHLKPRRVIEIGSGYSSAVTLDTNELFLGGQVQCTFIEPYPAVLHSLLKPTDLPTTEVLPVPLQEVELSLFHDLKANDVLFVDSTHVSKIGSDVNRIFFEILPELRPGVFIHFHDIFFPFEYPREWLEEGRAWNEAYLLRSFLQYNASFEIKLFNTYLAVHHRDLLAQWFPLCLRNTGGSIWLRRK
jgi:hypothetical protein